MKIYHQAGHNTNWNIDSYTKDGAGDGLIFSPVHYSLEYIQKVKEEIRTNCLFDPQFYIPDSQKKKLQSYDFFPETLMDGFSTDDFSIVAYEAARLCVNFQIENDFESIIVPCRFYSDLISDYIERQEAFSVAPFLSAIATQNIDKKIFLTVPLTAPMAIDIKFKTKLLNWITAYPEIDGVYLLVNFNDNRKQLIDFNKFYSYIEFIIDLIEADLSVICGYCNTEGIILSVLDLYGLTMGAYENTRGFSVDKFLESDIRMGPAPRLYFPKLLNWMRFDTAMEIREDHPGLWDSIYKPTAYAEELINSPKKPHFTKPQLYKHHFYLINEQYKEIQNVGADKRLALVGKKIKNARLLYERIEDAGVMFFDSNCSGEHLAMWNRVVNKLKTAQ